MAGSGEYEILEALGMIGTLDESGRLKFIDIQHFKCKPDDAAKTAIKMLDPTPVYQDVYDKSEKGSLGFFVASGSLQNNERRSVSLVDVAKASLPGPCRLSPQEVLQIANHIPGVPTKIFYSFNATLSHLTWETMADQGANVQASAGSWLSIGGSMYKSQGAKTSIPLISVSGFYVDMTSPDASKALALVTDLGLPSRSDARIEAA